MKGYGSLSSSLISSAVSPHQFRIFKKQGERRAFRLERAFWEILERAAKQQNKRVGELVFEIVNQSQGVSNLSSILRCYAVLWLDEQVRSIDTRLVSDSAFAVFHASPASGLILDEDRNILSLNRSFQDFMWKKTGYRMEEMSEIRLSFDLTIPQILERVTEKAVECGFRFLLNGVPVNGTVRISKLVSSPQEARRLLVFIL